MTLIVFNYSVFGAPFGAGTQARRLVSALAQSGQRIRVFSADAEDVGLMSDVEGVTVQVIPASRFRNSLIRSLAGLRWRIVATSRLHRMMRQDDICLVGPNYSLLIIALLASKLSGAKLVHWSADEQATGDAGSHINRIFWQSTKFKLHMRSYILRQADVIVSSSAQSARHIAKKYRIPDDRVALIEPPSTIRATDPTNSSVRSEWGFQSEFVVGCCCRFLDKAGLQIILDAADRLAQRHDIVFAFISGGPLSADLEAETQRRSLANIRLPPSRPPSQLADCLAAADVHIVTLPSGADPLAIPDLFYSIAAAGRPTIFVGDLNTELARLITRTKCGASVKNAERLQWWIEDLRRWILLRNDMGVKARALGETRSHSNRWIDEWQAMVSRLAAAPRRSSRLSALRPDFRKKELPENTPP